MLKIEEFDKKHDYLICIDSDGTAIDAMNVKHKRCHGVAFIEEWGLSAHAKEVQDVWNQINLYNTTRGVNRYIALVEMLQKMQGTYLGKVEGLDILEKWVATTPELSNKYLKYEMETNNAEILKKALHWSISLNEKISALKPEDKPPFDGVIDCLRYAHGKVDIAVVSSSNFDAIYAEWGHYDMLKYLDVMTSQEVGTKGQCIAAMLDKGYKKENVLMLGDAYPDVDATKQNGVYYYPILINHEKESWCDLKDKYLDEFMHGHYGEYQQLLFDKFYNNFGK